jgi:hypothetical protein
MVTEGHHPAKKRARVVPAIENGLGDGSAAPRNKKPQVSGLRVLTAKFGGISDFARSSLRAGRSAPY